MKVKMKRSKTFIVTLFVLYLAVLAFLLFHRTAREGRSYNLIPLETIRNWLDLLVRDDPLAVSFRPISLANLLGNLFVLLPMGFFFPALFSRQKSFWLFLLTTFLLVCLIELVQLLTRRGALDIDDLLLNVPGACLGWLGWRFWSRKKE